MSIGFSLTGSIGLAVLFGGALVGICERDFTSLNMRFEYAAEGMDIYYQGETILRPEEETNQWTQWRVDSSAHVARCEPYNERYRLCEREQNRDILVTIKDAAVRANRPVPLLY